MINLYFLVYFMVSYTPIQDHEILLLETAIVEAISEIGFLPQSKGKTLCQDLLIDSEYHRVYPNTFSYFIKKVYPESENYASISLPIPQHVQYELQSRLKEKRIVKGSIIFERDILKKKRNKSIFRVSISKPIPLENNEYALSIMSEQGSFVAFFFYDQGKYTLCNWYLTAIY